MRYPDDNTHNNSINLSNNIGVVGEESENSHHHHPLRLPSSSSISQESQNSMHEATELLDNDIPGRTPESKNGVGGGKANNSIETISEHVLFGNNNGHNSFLYLYYSSSSNSGNRNHIKTHQNSSLLKRPYTTGGEAVVAFHKGEGTVMGSSGNESSTDPLKRPHPWNGERGGECGSEDPPTIFSSNNNEEEEYGDYYFGLGEGRDNGTVKLRQMNFSGESGNDNGIRNSSDLTPYPVYRSPTEGSPIRSLSISPKQMNRDEEDTDEEDDEENSRTSSRISGGSRQNRLDPFGNDLLMNDDWDKVYGVPDVNPRYILSTEQCSSRELDAERERGLLDSSSSMDHPWRHDDQDGHFDRHSCNRVNKKHYQQPRPIVKQQSSPTAVNNASVSKILLNSPTNHIHKQVGAKQGSVKKVRVVTEERRSGGREPGLTGHHGYNSFEGNSGSVKSGERHGQSNKRLTPMGSLDPSRTPSTRSLNPTNSRHGVTHHHRPWDAGQNGDDGDEARGSDNEGSVTSADHLDQMSFQFQNGIGAFFGTPASKQISQKHEPTPEEMYEEEMQGWRPRLATGATIFFATMFILSCASLLFVFPILVDPILVGFEAEFSKDPVMCRTTNFRNGSGSSECATPSCREGCTVDLFSCIFVDVEYLSDPKKQDLLLSPKNSTRILDAPGSSMYKMPNGTNNGTSTSNTEYRNISSSQQMPSLFTNNSRQKRSATLLINVNGCGYPPQVTCSDFAKKYAPLNTQFPCYYSKQNESIVVPEYSRGREIIHLTLAMCVPFGTILISGTSLYLLIRYHKYLKMSIYKKYAERKRAVRAKRREEWEEAEKNANAGEAVEGVDGEDKNVTSTNTTSMADIELQQQGKKVMHNGASYNGTRLIEENTDM